MVSLYIYKKKASPKKYSLHSGSVLVGGRGSLGKDTSVGNDVSTDTLE